MTNEAFHQAYLEDAQAAHDLFEQMSTRDLLHLRAAHTIDAAQRADPGAIAFCFGRLGLIADVLSRRDDAAMAVTVEEPRVRQATTRRPRRRVRR